MATKTESSKIYEQYTRQLLEATLKKGAPLKRNEIKDVIPQSVWASMDSSKKKDYADWYNTNIASLTAEETQQMLAEFDNRQATAQMEQLTQTMNSLYPSLDVTNVNEQGLNSYYQQYLDALNQTSQTQYNVAMDELARAENEMYRAVGLSQRQMERDIAKRRQQALKSGMSTAQLAAQEQQNILAAQTGASAIAQEYANQRYNTINSFAGVQGQNYLDALTQQTNQSQNFANTMAQVYPQYFAAKQSLEP